MAENPAGFRALSNSGRRPAPGAVRVAAADPKESLSVSIRVRPQPGGPASLDALAFASKLPGQRQYLSREEYAARHGAAPADLDQVTAFAQSHGLRITESSAARRTVVVSGTVEQMNKAFGVDLGHYQAPSGSYRGHDGPVQVPAPLEGIIESVHGLDNRPLARPLSKMAAAGAVTAPLTPPQVAALYHFPAVRASGQTIGILEFGGGYQAADVENYFRNVVQLPVPNVSFVGVDGATNSPGGLDDSEVILDIAVAGAVAPGAKIVIYFAPNSEQGWMDAVTTALHDTTNKPSVLSISWGGAESLWGAAISSVSTALAEAPALGVTVFAASGDSGSEQPAAVMYPASDPWITACGGTTIENVAGASFTQVAWPGSGGGVSGVFPLPNWQKQAGVPPSINPPGHVGRGVPDIAGNADPGSGYMLILNGAKNGPWGGTSAVAPLYAGMVALLNASLGEPAGYLNYNLYAMAGPYINVDVSAGNNGGYNAGPGWDAVTGWGSIEGNALATALRGGALPPALAVFHGRLYLAWKGLQSDESIYWSSFDGAHWAPAQKTAGATSCGVALAAFNDKLYMTFRGAQADQNVYWSSFNGADWGPREPAGGAAGSIGPRLAVLQGRLYMAWKGIETDQRLYWSSFDGTHWTAPQQIPAAASSAGPALAVFNNELYAAWKGAYGDQSLWFAAFNGASWSAPKHLSGLSSEGASLAVFNSLLYAAWKGEFDDPRVFWSTFDGATWAPQQQIPGATSSTGPGLAVFGNALYAAWQGISGDRHMWWSIFSGWAPQQALAGTG